MHLLLNSTYNIRKLSQILFVSTYSDRSGPVVTDIFDVLFYGVSGPVGPGNMGSIGIGVGGMGGMGIGGMGIRAPINFQDTPAIAECKKLSELWSKLLESYENTFARLTKMK